MSNINDLITEGSNYRRGEIDAESASLLFKNAAFDQIGTDKELTKFLHQSLDPNGSKYGGDTKAMKEGILNDTTARGASAIGSIWDAIGARSEGVPLKQFNNLLGRIYESAPNRLVSGNADEAYQAIKSGLVGAVGYDSPILALTAVGKTAFGIGRAGLEAAGVKLAGREGVTEALGRSAAAEAGSLEAKQALAEAGSALTRSEGLIPRTLGIEAPTWAGVKQGAIIEGAENAVLGGLGDIGQQDAAVQRGLQDSISGWSSLANIAGGGVVGGAFGTIGGTMSGKALGRTLKESLPGRADGIRADIAASLSKAADEVPVFDSSKEAYSVFNQGVLDARGDLEEFGRMVKSGILTSEYTQPHLDAMHSAMVRLSNSNAVGEQYLAKAADFRAAGDMTEANRWEAKADTFTRFANHMMKQEAGVGELYGVTGDINRVFVDLLKQYDDEVAAAFAVKAAPTAKAAPGVPGGEAPPSSAVAGSPSEPGAAAVTPAQTIQATEQVAAKESLAATTAVEPAGAPTAADITAMAETKFSPEEKQALTSMTEIMTKAGSDLQTVLDSMASKGQAQTVADLAKASGVERGAVQDAMSKVTAATQREAAKVAPVAKAAEVAPASAAENTVAAGDAVDAADARLAAVQTGIANLEQEFAAGSASMDYIHTAQLMKEQREAVGKVLDDALDEMSKLAGEPTEAGGKAVPASKEQKVAAATKAIEAAIAAHPELEPMLSRLDPEKLTSAKGVNTAKLKLKQMVDNAIDFTYAKVVGDVLPDALNVEHFGVVLKAMLTGVPADDVNRITQSYRHMVYNSLVERINAVGIDNVVKDATLGPAWDRLVQGTGGFQPMGGKTKVTADVGEMVNRNFQLFEEVLKAGKHDVAAANKMLTEAAGVVRDFMKQLQASGIPMDSKFMLDALEHRANGAVRDAIEGTFRKENAEAFDKIKAMNELRRRDKGGTRYVRTSNHGRNPFFGGIEDNPILHRVKSIDDDGYEVYTDMIVSGRSQPRSDSGVRGLGRPQSALSDGISDYFGLLWSNPKKMFAATSAARNAILGGAVDAASWARGSLEINGQMFKGSMKELKGLYKETANKRLEQARVDLIIDAAERRRLDPGDSRYLGADAYQAYIDKIGSIERRVSDDEKFIAEMSLDHKERIRSNNAVVQEQMKNILADAADMGESGAEQINAIVAKLNAFKAKNDGNLLSAMDNYHAKAQKVEARSKMVKGKDGSAVKEGSVKGEAASEPVKAVRDYVMTIQPNGGASPSFRDTNTVVLLKIDTGNGVVKKEFLPADHIIIAGDGSVKLFGEKIGTWTFDQNPDVTHKRPILLVEGKVGEMIHDLTSMSNMNLVRNFSDLFKRNADKLTDAAPVARNLPDGSQIDKSLSQTAAIKEAQNELLQPAAVKLADLDKRIDSFDVPADRVLVMKRKSDSRIVKPDQTQGGLSVRDFLSKFRLTPDEVEIGTIPAGRMSKAGKLNGLSTQQRLRQFTPLGRDTGTVDMAIVTKMAEKKENAPLMLEAQRKAISFSDAEKIKVDGERTLADVLNEFDRASASLEWTKIGDIDTLNAVIAGMEKQAALIESVAPHGVKRNNASRRTSFFYLQQHLAKFSEEERGAALDMLRRLDSDRGGMPYFEGIAGHGNSFAIGNEKHAGKTVVFLGEGGDAVPKHVVVTHEIGHWAYVNMLTPSEKLQFIRSLSKHYDADGKLSIESVMSGMENATALEAAAGKQLKGARTGTNELFAWQFTNWYMNQAVGKAGYAAEQTLWEKVVKYGKNLLSHFIGQKVDPELVPLFERILPSTMSERKFDYGQLYDQSTGKIVKDTEIGQQNRDKVGLVTDVMENIDNLRGRLGQQLFTPGGAVDSGFTEDLKAAANHMFGLLYGKDDRMWGKFKGQYLKSMTVTGLRGKLLRMTGNMTGDDRWVRDTSGKLNAAGKYPIKKGEDGHALVKQVPRLGVIDPRDMFSRNETGKLMQAIRDVLPEGHGDNVAFEAAAGAEEFNVLIKDTSIDSDPVAKLQYKQTIEEEFARLVKSGMNGEDALDAAEMIALREAAANGKDVENALFSQDGARVLLGNDGQRAALGQVGRKLYDLMSDALDHLESEVDGFGYGLKRVTREVTRAELTAQEQIVDKAVADVIAKAKIKKAPKTVAPATEKSAAVVAREESERVDGLMDGVPSDAPSQWKALILRVPHRDVEQNNIIGTMMYRMFSHIAKDGDDITNADIARITGIALEDGAKPDAMASSSTAAFDSLRKSLRLASEELSNGNKNPMGAVDFLIEVLSRHVATDLADEFDLPGFSDVAIAGLAKRMARGENIKADGMEGALYELVGAAADILSGLGKTSNAEKIVGETAATQGKPISVRFENGMYHPLFARGAIESLLANLPKKITDDLLSALGLNKTAKLADAVGFMSTAGRKRIFTTVDEMMAAKLTDSRIELIDGEIAKAMSDGDADAVSLLMVKRQALENEIAPGSTDGVIPVLVNMSKVYDPVMSFAAANAAIKDAMDSGGFKTLDDALKSLGYTGKLEGEALSMFTTKGFKYMDEEIARVSALKRNLDAGDTPLTGEIILNMAFEEGQHINPLAVEQRALQAGATEGIARIISGFFKKGRPANGLSDEQSAVVRTFHGIQFSTNAVRMRNDGASWLSDLIAPVEGTGFDNALPVKMASSLNPLLAKLNKLSGPTNFLTKAGSEIIRNLHQPGHVIPQSATDLNIAMAMRKNDISKLTMEEKQMAVGIQQHLENMRKMLNDAGIGVRDIREGADGFYLTQQMNRPWVMANREEAVRLLGDKFKKDRKGGSNVESATDDARKVISEVINREDLQGIIDSASSVYTQAFGDKLHSRKFKIAGDDWDTMAPLFNNNLRTLVTAYTEAAHRRVEWSQRFGVRGHGVSTYLDIADRGATAAIEALNGTAQGMKYVISGVSAGEAALASHAHDVEGISNLFSPMTRDKYAATRLTAEIVKTLEAGRDEASRAGIVNGLVKKFVADGGSGELHFKKRAEAVVNGLADFGDEGRTVAKDEINFMLKMVGTLEGRPAHTIASNQGMRNAASAVKTVNTVTLLSSVVLSSLADPVLSLIRSGSGKAWLKGMTGAIKLAMNDPAHVEAMMRIGVTMPSILSENLTHMNGGISGRINNAFHNATGLIPWTNATRQFSALVGFESIKANQLIVQRERFNGNIDTLAYRKSMRYLRQLGLGYLADTDKLDSFAAAVNDIKVAEAIHKFTDESVFQPNRNDMPLWTQDPIASIVWQFKSYPMMMGRLAKRTLKEATAFESGGIIGKLKGEDVGKYAGDPMGLMYLLTVGAAAGAGSMYAKDVLMGKNQAAEDGDPRSARERTLSKVMQELGYKDFDLDSPGVDAVLGNYAQGLLSLGALGFLGDLMYQSARSVDNGAFGRERIMSQIAGPAMGAFMDTIQLVEGVHDGATSDDGFGNGSAKQRNAVRKVVSRIPFVGKQDPWVEAWVNGSAGEAENPKVTAP